MEDEVNSSDAFPVSNEYNDSENAYSSEKDDSLNYSNKDNELEKIYFSLLEMYQKSQYRKIIGIILQAKSFENCKNFWKLLHLKILCIQEIIDKKFRKYQDKIAISRIQAWLKFYDDEVSAWLTNLTEGIGGDLDLKFIKLELLITFILKQCYNYAKYSLGLQFVSDSIGFLSLAERIIQKTSDFFVSPDSYNVASKIYIFLSSFFIANENLTTAKNYLCVCLKLLYQELEIRINNDYNPIVFIGDLTKTQKESISEIFFNFSVAFFHLGACYESENELEKAMQSYNQAKWFGNMLKQNKTIIYSDMLYELVERIKIRDDLITFFTKEEAKLKNQSVKEERKNGKLYANKERVKKFENLERYIDNLKINEIDDDEQDLLNEIDKKPFSQKVGTITKSIHVLNYLMSEQFQDVINKMSKIEVNNLSRDTKREVQKKIIDIKNNQRMQMIRKAKKKEERLNKRNSNFPKQTSTFFNTTTKHSTETNVTMCNTLHTQCNEKSTPVPKPRPRTAIKREVEKIKYSNYLFNKKFQKKIRFLDGQYNKEIKFQKELLHCKDEEKFISYEPYNERKVISKCEAFFENHLERERKKIEQKEQAMMGKDSANKSKRTLKRIKIAFNTKTVQEFGNQSMREYIMGGNQIDSTSDINKINQKCINNIQRDLDSLNKVEKNYQKKIKLVKSQVIAKTKF